MSRALDQATKKSYVMVRFTYGPTSISDPLYLTAVTKKAYTNWTSDITGDPVFESVPAMEVEFPENISSIDKKVLKIRLPRDTYTNRISSGDPVSPTFVEVWEKILPTDAGDTATTFKAFIGRVSVVTRNPNGRPEVVEIQATHPKSTLDVRLVWPANHQCAWTFGEGHCGLTRAYHSAEIVSINGVTLTIDPTGWGAADMPHNNIDRFYHRGFVERGGVRVDIRDWRISDPTTFHLARRPPADWGGTITVYEGCDKTIESCRTRHSFSGEDYFMGSGYGIPGYDPRFEMGDG